MGRYANFNTGFSYKFAFAVQSSADITKFGGKCAYLSDEDSNGVWIWTAIDKPFLLKAVEHLHIEFEKYTFSCAGTDDLYNEICKIAKDHKDILGALIYHQLLYTPTLIAEFEF